MWQRIQRVGWSPHRSHKPGASAVRICHPHPNTILIMATVFQIEDQYHYLLKAVDTKYVQSGLTYGWPATQYKSFDQGHWNRQILKNSKMFPFDHGKMPYIDHDPVLKNVWEMLQHTLGRTNLLRCYINGYTYGTDGYAHVDDIWVDEQYGVGSSGTTIIVYLNETWDIDWAGETVIFDSNKEIETSLLPKYGRVLSFESNKLHAARPVSRACQSLRKVLVFKTVHDVVNSKEIEFLIDKTRHLPHSGKSFFEHLYNTMILLENKKQSKDVCAAGLFHSIYGTEFYQFNEPTITRSIIKKLIGEYAESLVYEFCNLTNRLDVLLGNLNNYKESFLKDLLMIEMANLIEQNASGKYTDDIVKIQSRI